MTQIPFFDAREVQRRLPFERAMDAIEAALRADVDPEFDGPRLFSPAPGGEFLLMPAQGSVFSGLKALTVAPDNPARGLEKIQGLYILFSSDTLSPIAVMEGASLTAIRTPAVTVSAVRQLAAAAPEGHEIPPQPTVLIFGAGIQAASHIRAAAVAFRGAHFEVVGRRPERVAALIEQASTASESAGCSIVDRGADIGAAVAGADIIICATSSRTPLFDGELVQDRAIVAAIGTHGRGLREVDDALVSRADIVVEGRTSAERENGNLATWFSESDWAAAGVPEAASAAVAASAQVVPGAPAAPRAPGAPANLRELARGEVTRRPGRPAFYTGVGMSWEDLICATAVFTQGSESLDEPEETR